MTMKGLKHSEDTIQKMRKAALKQWKRPGHRNRVAQSNLETWSKPSVKENHKKSLIAAWKNEKRRSKASKMWKKFWTIKSFREKFMGPRHHFWKGGIQTNDRGYKLQLYPSHPFADRHGYVREHRLIVEQMIGRYLKPSEVVHHLGETGDNRPHMLMCFASDGAHKKFHKGIPVPPNDIVFDGRSI